MYTRPMCLYYYKLQCICNDKNETKNIMLKCAIKLHTIS